MICEIKKDCFLHTFSIEVCIPHCILTENQTTI
ncbi:hypothetical protein T4C_1134 [Trichinella pseudospiralis]|uniref:Uncharacterized protein n=1 Tax=Trichinella pseudospiralis TaxID=6337 RepID=A0A0V1GCT9_TRIPS|nr:hypothetical protein T4C_9837 [Trichinella pseudospiralis]KRY97185.1 hypothetical protein T4C_1134 [Trichinella pseudospiralis]